MLIGQASSHLFASGERWSIVGAIFIAVFGVLQLIGQRPPEDSAGFGKWQVGRAIVLLSPRVIVAGGVMMIAAVV